MSIKMTLTDGSIIEGSAEDIAKLQQIASGEQPEKVEDEETFDKPARVGDRIRIINAYHTCGLYENGDTLTVSKLDGDGDIEYVNEFKRSHFIADDEYEIIGREDTEAIEEELRKQFSEGDKVRLVRGGGRFPLFGFNDGEEYTVRNTEYRNDAHSTINLIAIEDGAAVGYALPSQLEKLAKSFEEGDRVKLVIPEGSQPRHRWGRVSNGDIGTVSSVLEKQVSVNFPKQNSWMALPSELKKIGEEVFEPGDYAKVVGETHYGDAVEGTIVKVERSRNGFGDYRINLLDGTDFDFAEPESLEKYEPSESDLNFLLAGRNVGEFRPGDIARVVDSPCALPEGTIFEVKHVYSDGTVEDSTPEGLVYMHPESQLKPIAFAENRADIDV